MAQDTTRAAELPDRYYPPGTRWDVTPDFPVEYSLVGKEAVLEFRKNRQAGAVWQLITGEHADFAISGQEIQLALNPATASTLATAVTFGELVAANKVLEYRIDVRVASAATTDYRFQGRLIREPSHGPRIDP